jgi:hypothetical protein
MPAASRIARAPPFFASRRTHATCSIDAMRRV